MFTHFFPRAHFSAASSNRVPAPLLLCLSLTMNALISARVGTSIRWLTLTCSQPITSPSHSATNNPSLAADFKRLNRDLISAAVAGYPSSPLSAARFAASPLFARRIFGSDGLFFFVIERHLRRAFHAAAWGTQQI